MRGNEETEVRMERKLVTPAMAREWLTNFNYPHQRALNEARVKEFMEYLKQGEWNLDVMRFHEVAELNGKKMVTDGQHRLNAVARSGLSAPFLVHSYQVDSMERVHRDYGCFDTPKLRTFKDVLPGSGLLEKSNLASTQLTRISASSRMIEARFQAIQTSKDRLQFRNNTHCMDRVDQWLQEGAAFYQAIAGAQKVLASPLQNQGVMSVALVTFNQQPDKAAEFWNSVAQNDGLHRGDPEWALVDWLTRMRGKKTDVVHTSRLVAACWNAFFEERRLHIVKGDKTQPIKIKGTTWKG